MDERPRSDLSERLASALSADARGLYGELQGTLDANTRGELSDAETERRLEEIMGRLDALAPSDRETVIRLFEHESRALQVNAAENLEVAEMARQAADAIERAQALQRAAGETVDENMTVLEALAALERHGEDVPEIDAALEVDVPVEVGPDVNPGFAAMAGGVPSPFGACPECGSQGAYGNIHRRHFFYCDEHRLTWSPGANLMSSWRDEAEADWRETWEHVKDYRTVDGFGGHSPGPPLREQITFGELLETR